MLRRIGEEVLGLVGAVVGGWLGYLGFSWAWSQNFYALVLPGAFLGLGCSLLSARRSLIRGILCAIAALFLGLYTEWKFRPFVADDSFVYLVTHIHLLRGVTQLMLVVGVVLAFWMGKDSGYASFVKTPGKSAAREGSRE